MYDDSLLKVRAIPTSHPKKYPASTWSPFFLNTTLGALKNSVSWGSASRMSRGNLHPDLFPDTEQPLTSYATCFLAFHCHSLNLIQQTIYLDPPWNLLVVLLVLKVFQMTEQL